MKTISTLNNGKCEFRNCGIISDYVVLDTIIMLKDSPKNKKSAIFRSHLKPAVSQKFNALFIRQKIEAPHFYKKDGVI